VALSEAAQLKLAIEMSKKDLHGSQASDSGAGTDEGAGSKLEVPNVPKDNSDKDIAALFCLFDDQPTSRSPSICILLDVLRLVSWQPA
ncbi:hypothetical protein Tco_0440328, partial [Tanacetum coccineum]